MSETSDVKGTDTPVITALEKMSKSKGNVVNPDDMANEFGADSMRLYEMFMGPLEDGTEWETAGVSGTRRFLDRVWRIAVDAETGGPSGKLATDGGDDNRELERALHAAIKKVTEAPGAEDDDAAGRRFGGSGTQARKSKS